MKIETNKLKNHSVIKFFAKLWPSILKEIKSILFQTHSSGPQQFIQLFWPTCPGCYRKGLVCNKFEEHRSKIATAIALVYNNFNYLAYLVKLI